MKKHKGNLTVIISFSLLSIAVLISALTWTSAMKFTTKNRASANVNQYSIVALSNLLESAIVKDIGNMTATKGNDFIVDLNNTAEKMLEAMQDSQFSLNSDETELVYKVTDPNNIIKNTAMEIAVDCDDPDSEENKVLADSVQEDLAEFTLNAKMKCILYTEVEEDGIIQKKPELIYNKDRVYKDEEGNISCVYLEPFYLEIHVERGTSTVTQLYRIEDADVVFWKATDGFYAAVRTDTASVEKVSQNVGTYEVELKEAN